MSNYEKLSDERELLENCVGKIDAIIDSDFRDVHMNIQHSVKYCGQRLSVENLEIETLNQLKAVLYNDIRIKQERIDYITTKLNAADELLGN